MTKLTNYGKLCLLS